MKKVDRQSFAVLTKRAKYLCRRESDHEETEPQTPAGSTAQLNHASCEHQPARNGG